MYFPIVLPLMPLASLGLTAEVYLAIIRAEISIPEGWVAARVSGSSYFCRHPPMLLGKGIKMLYNGSTPDGHNGSVPHYGQ